jgi:PAS domain S-box-containing protein
VDPSVVQTGGVSLAAAALTVYAFRQPRGAGTQWLIASLMVLIVPWSAGIALEHRATSDEAVQLGFTLANIGALWMAPIWFLVAARYSRLSVFEERYGTTLALVVPTAILALAIVTNPGHRLFANDLRLGTYAFGPLYWAGPLYWMFIAWNLGLVALTSLLFFSSALRLVSRSERWRGFGLAAAPLGPAAAEALHFAGLLPVRLDPTPSVTALSLVWVYVSNLRHVLETLPIARRDVIQHLSEGVIVTGREGRILDLNPAARVHLGASDAALRDRTAGEVLRGLVDDPGELERDLGELLGGGPTVTRELRTADERLIELTATAVKSGDGEVAGMAVLLRDRTELRRTERFLRQSQRLETVASLAAGMAHEINNPLAFVRSNLGHLHRMAQIVEEKAELLGEGAADELLDLRQVVEETMEGVERIGTVVSHMQRFARLSTDEITDVDVNQVVTEALRLAALHQNDRVTVETDLRRPLPAVRGSPERLVQAVLNLLVNARQALAERAAGRVRVETRSDPQQVEIRVSDDGPGVPAALGERIFDPFFTTRAADGGAGLGLSIAFDIVREHGGALELAPSAEGATFVIQLPTKAGRLLSGLR